MQLLHDLSHNPAGEKIFEKPSFQNFEFPKQLAKKNF